MKPIIRVENLSKQYTIGAKAEPYSTLRESLVRAARKPVDMMRRKRKAENTHFWALKDVSFDVMPGEVVGIIGRNGAGKSTLLKILSRITEPTGGRVELYGRVGSLLEVGTGFHAELTGRENIYLNGAILGIRRAEIENKFDEIVDFAEIEEFLDTPVKRYSSGMYVRLAFAVAAHLEPEILIVDEVLAVGDAEFQKKCLGKMKEVSQHGRTVLFVSHNTKAVQRLCQSCILLNEGKVIESGDSSHVIQAYVDSIGSGILDVASAKAVVTGIEICSADGNKTSSLKYGQSLKIRISILAKQLLRKLAVDIALYSDRVRILALQSDRLTNPENISEGEWEVSFEIDPLSIVAGDLHLDVGLREMTEPYFLLITEAKHLEPDYSTIPENISTDCIIYPKAACLWSSR